MTVAIGLVCADGVIVASDSMGSDGPIARPVQKVHTIPSASAIWTSSGLVYVSEEVENAITRATEAANSPFNACCRSGKPQDIRDQVALTVRPAMQTAYGSALPQGPNQMVNVPGQMMPQHQFATSFIFAGFAKGTPWLLEIAGDGQLNWHTEYAFFAIGSGGPFATVAQALMKHYWTQPRSVEDGRLVAYRTIATTIEVSSSFIGPPVTMAEVTASGSKVLELEDVDDLGVSVDRWKALESESLSQLRDGDLGHVPPEIGSIPVLPSDDGESRPAI
jgi:proteasome beta subunit